jgi:hypothetical protein
MKSNTHSAKFDRRKTIVQSRSQLPGMKGEHGLWIPLNKRERTATTIWTSKVLIYGQLQALQGSSGIKYQVVRLKAAMSPQLPIV